MVYQSLDGRQIRALDPGLGCWISARDVVEAAAGKGLVVFVPLALGHAYVYTHGCTHVYVHVYVHVYAQPYANIYYTHLYTHIDAHIHTHLSE